MQILVTYLLKLLNNRNVMRDFSNDDKNTTKWQKKGRVVQGFEVVDGKKESLGGKAQPPSPIFSVSRIIQTMSPLGWNIV